MSRPLPYLSDAQQKMVLAALASLRMTSHDRFLLDLASALAHSPNQPVTDLDVRIAIRQLLGVVPIKDIVRMEAAMLSDRQVGYVTKARPLLPTAAQAQFRQQVATMLGYAQHPTDDRTLLDLLRPLLAQHGLSIGEVLPPPRREYARIEKGPQHVLL